MLLVEYSLQVARCLISSWVEQPIRESSAAAGRRLYDTVWTSLCILLASLNALFSSLSDARWISLKFENCLSTEVVLWLRSFHSTLDFLLLVTRHASFKLLDYCTVQASVLIEYCWKLYVIRNLLYCWRDTMMMAVLLRTPYCGENSQAFIVAGAGVIQWGWREWWCGLFLNEKKMSHPVMRGKRKIMMGRERCVQQSFLCVQNDSRGAPF